MGETNYYSPADIAAVMNGSNNNGMNWNSPMWLIWALLFGNGAFGGYGKNGEGLQNAEIQGKLNALSQQIQDNQNTNTLSSGINGCHEQLHGVNAAISAASMANVLGQKDAQAQMASCCCDIKSNILNQTNSLQSQIAQLANGVQTGFANIGFLTQQQTNELNTNANANTQRILDHLCSAETQNLRDKLAQASQNEQTAYIISQLKTT